MQKILTHIADFARHWPHLFSTRVVVVLLFLLTIIPSSSFPWFERFDDALYRVAGYLGDSPVSDKLVVLTLPPASRHESTLKAQHLVSIKAAGPAAIALISDQHLGELGSVLARNQVYVGRGVSRASGEVHHGAIDFSSDTAGHFVDRSIKSKLLEIFYDRMPGFDYQQHAVPSYQSYPVARDRGLADYPLYWQPGNESVQNPDLVTVLYKEWGGKIERTDLVGQLRAVGMPAEKIPESMPLYKYSDIVADRDYSVLRGKLVLIGPRNELALVNAAMMLNSMMTEKVITVPTWSLLSKLALSVMVLIYLMLLHKCRLQTALLLSAFMLTLILTAQAGFLVTKQIWLPFGSVLAFLVFGHIMMASIRLRLQQQLTSSHEHDVTLVALAEYQVGNGDMEKAFITLQQCSATDETLELMYRIGIEYERQRKYERALQVYQHITGKRHAFQDVRSRIKSLQHADDPTGTISSFNSVRTLIMPSANLEKPVLGRYELERELGRGAMGVVYLGKDPKILRQVAIKTMDLKQFAIHEVADIKARFFREAEAAGKLNHPNIVTIFDAGEDGDLAFIAMDYASGSPLSNWTKPDKLLPIETVFNIIAQVAQALDYAHRQGIVHRDIKPGNIIFDPDDERVRVTDFGIARITDTSATRTGTIMGSPSYMSPEQVTESSVDGRSDIFSLGVTLYQLLTGELPFKGDSLASVAYQITNKKHQSVRDVRPELSIKVTRVVNKALQKKADKRYATGEEMAAALLKL